MPLFDHTGDKLAAGPALLLPADPGAALLHIGFYTAYWSPRVYRAAGAPPALGPLRKGPLHHWDLNTGMPPGRASPELQLKLAEAALALAGRAGGIAVDMFGFRFGSPQELVSVSERTPAP